MFFFAGLLFFPPFMTVYSIVPLRLGEKEKRELTWPRCEGVGCAWVLIHPRASICVRSVNSNSNRDTATIRFDTDTFNTSNGSSCTQRWSWIGHNGASRIVDPGCLAGCVCENTIHCEKCKHVHCNTVVLGLVV